MSHTCHCLRSPHLLGLSCALLLGAFACGDDGDDGTTPDASITDAALPDAALPDAFIPDATPPDAMPVVPVFRNPVALDDAALATQSLQLLGSPAVGGTLNCNDCHGLTRQALRHWRALSDESLRDCITDLEVVSQASALSMIDCMREDPADQMSPFRAGQLGIYSTAAHLDWFEFAFWRAYGTAEYESRFEAFKTQVLMPQGAHEPFTQEEFDIVAEWFARGLPLLDDTLPEDPPPTTCTEGVSADVGLHVAAMETVGWTAKNQENNLLMFGCGGAATVLDCLSSYPRSSTVPGGAVWETVPDSKMRILRQNGYRSSYWTRSSADGRFVGHGRSGGPTGAAVVDLMTDSVISISALYDPAFFPDNSGFMFQAGNGRFCEQDLLTTGTDSVDFSEPGCTTSNAIGLYQHLAASVDGGDYWAVAGQFVSDNGGRNPTLQNPNTTFSSNTTMRLTPIVNTGSGYQPQSNITVPTPFEGDAVISPSAKLVVSRLAGPSRQIGFVMREIRATMNGGGGYTVEAPEVARYCIDGGKPGFSLDERWMVLHHYVEDSDAIEMGYTGSDDPAFAPYLSQGAANLYLVDLVTGQIIRISNMPPGQYALFPHFRSDGWIYFMVRTIGQQSEYIVATDAALLLANTP